MKYVQRLIANSHHNNNGNDNNNHNSHNNNNHNNNKSNESKGSNGHNHSLNHNHSHNYPSFTSPPTIILATDNLTVITLAARHYPQYRWFTQLRSTSGGTRGELFRMFTEPYVGYNHRFRLYMHMQVSRFSHNTLIITHPLMAHPLISHPIISHPLISHPLISHPLISHPLINHHLISHPVITIHAYAGS